MEVELKMVELAIVEEVFELVEIAVREVAEIVGVVVVGEIIGFGVVEMMAEVFEGFVDLSVVSSYFYIDLDV